jgi:hypothetical protein
MTFNITNVQLSHFALTDIPVLSFSLLAFFVIVKIMEGASSKTYLLAGFLIGLAMATKYQAAFLAFSLALAHFMAPGKIISRKPFFSIAGMASGFFIGSPFCFLDYKNFLPYFIRTKEAVASQSYGFACYRITEALPLYIVKELLPYAMSWVLTVFCVIAILYAIKKRTKADILFLATIFIFLLYVILSGWTYLKPRHIIHLFPLFFILIGRMFCDISAAIFTEERKRRTFLISITVLALIPSLNEIWTYEGSIVAKPVWIKAKEWIESNVPASAKIASQDGIPIEPNEESIKRKLKEVTDEKIGHGVQLKAMLTNRNLFPKTYDIYELPYPWRLDFDESDFDFARHIKEGVRFFVFTEELTNYLREPEKYPAQIRYYNSVKEKCSLRTKLSSRFFRAELGNIKEDPYVLIYEYKGGK